MISFSSCADIGIGDLHTAMCLAFSDYILPMQPDIEQFRFMLKQRGFDPELSHVAMHKGSVAAFWLIGTNGRDRAYVIATGTVPSLRGRQLAQKTFENVAAAISADGLRALELEVIESNRVAIGLYEKIGFETLRLFDCYRLDRLESAPAPFPIVRYTSLPENAADMWEFPPSWQNSSDSIARIIGQVEISGIELGGKTAAYAAYIPSTGTLAQIGVDARFRRCGLAGALVNRLRRDDTVRLLNVDRRDNALKAFLAAMNAQIIIGQILMAKSDCLAEN